MVHNETVNIWTHLIGVGLFVLLFWYSFFMLGYSQILDESIPEILDHVRKTDSSAQVEIVQSWWESICNSPLRNTTDISQAALDLCMNFQPRQAVAIWPIMVFIASAVFCLSCSSLYHLFNSHSELINSLMSRLDYSGTSILIAGSFFPVIYYTFFCNPDLITLYLTSISTLCVGVFAVAMLPFFQTSNFRWLRGAVFLALGLMGFVPAAHFAYLPELSVFASALVYYGLMASSYIFGVLIYIARVPERFNPGKYDFFGSSHNIWHCFVLSAAILHFIGSLEALSIREVTFCPA